LREGAGERGKEEREKRKERKPSVQYVNDFFICVAPLLFRIIITVFCTMIASNVQVLVDYSWSFIFV